jgi:putative NADH-flavin reductase
MDHGHTVRVLVRSIHKLSDNLPDENVVEGDVRNPKDVAKVLLGTEVVISTLGMADISVSATDLSDGLKCILSQMRDASLKRIVAVGGASVLPHPAGGLRKHHDLAPFLINVSAEHERQWDALSNSGKNWTMVCPVFFNDDLPSRGYRVAREGLPELSDCVMIHDLADFIVKEAEHGDYLNCRVGIVSDRLEDA